MSRRRIWIAGHTGMVGSAIHRHLQNTPDTVLTVHRRDLDLRDQSAVSGWLLRNRPDVVIFAAAKVGGIVANDSLPASFIYDNLVLETNVIHGAHVADVNRLIFLGSSCIYPKHAAQPVKEDALLSGPLEPTNEWYAIAKIAGIKLCQAYRKQYGRSYISVMPCNLYGPNDNFDLTSGHVMPALMRRFHEARVDGDPVVQVWGSGRPKREFLHVDDLARAIMFCMERYDENEPINCGAGEDLSIAELAGLVRETVGFTGAVEFDAGRPDGTMRKLMDSSRLRALGWRPTIGLAAGMADTYRWFLDHHHDLSAYRTDARRPAPS